MADMRMFDDLFDDTKITPPPLPAELHGLARRSERPVCFDDFVGSACEETRDMEEVHDGSLLGG